MPNLRDIRTLLYTSVAAIIVIVGFFSLRHSPSLDSLHLPAHYNPPSPSASAGSSSQLFSPPQHSSAPSVHHEDKKPAAQPEKSETPEKPASNGKKEKLAYVTWLSSTVVGDDSENLAEDKYFTATRILVWQLLHHPKTKAKGIDVIVAVTPDVSASRRERLRKDGALVRPIEFVHGKDDSWLHPDQGRWNDIMSKLRVWEFVEYDRIAMLDGDIILQHNLDGVFGDPGAQVQTTLRNVSAKDDEAPLPDEYMLGSIGEVKGADHGYPPTWEKDLKKPGYFCAGFFLLKPSKEMFNYYTSVLNIPHRFDPKYMEQNLLNYAHRWDGPMPWKEIAYTWNIRSVNDNDLDKGVVSMHEKWWETPLSHSQRVMDIFTSTRWQMEGYYLAHDEQLVKDTPVPVSTHD